MSAIEIKKTTQTYSVVLKDEENNLIDPTTGITKLEIFVNNLATGTLIAQFTTDNPAAGEEITLSAVEAQFTIDTDKTELAESGLNQVTIWITNGTDVQCVTGLLNEYIEAKDS